MHMRPSQYNKALYCLLGLFLYFYGHGTGHGRLFISLIKKRKKHKRAKSPRIHEISHFSDNIHAQ